MRLASKGKENSMIKANMLAIKREGKDIVFYPYRTAQVLDAALKICCETNEERKECRDFREYLCRKANKAYRNGKLEEVSGVEPDNHICFLVGDVAVMFSDGRVRIGTKLEVRNW